MAVFGQVTGCGLADVTPLLAPWIIDNGISRPVFSHAAAALSLELASTAYDFRLDDWRQAEWYDISYQVDNTLLTGSSVNGGSGSSLSEAVSDYFQLLARSRVRRANPVTQIRGALRQREGSDTCKAVVMTHRIKENRFVIAIGFMGTGKRLADWLSNLRLEEENGAHQGFFQLAQEFEEQSQRILFPETARALGLDQLTLADIFDECRRADSRFLIWMAGHSQGGAILQLLAYRAIESGVCRQNLIGYGFASPSVMYFHTGSDLNTFPLHHLINSDDPTPRVGARLHIGRCWVMTPDEKMRRACYSPAWEDPAFRASLALIGRVRRSQDALLLIAALLKALEQVPDEESAAVITGVLGRFLPDRLLSVLGGHLDEGLRLLYAKTEQQYCLSSGQRCLPIQEVQAMQKRISVLMNLYGVRGFAKALMQSMVLPHKLRASDSEGGLAAYAYMVNSRFNDLRQRLWCAPAAASGTRCHPTHKSFSPAGRFAAYSASRARRQSHRR